jgi:hypothetical protein
VEQSLEGGGWVRGVDACIYSGLEENRQEGKGQVTNLTGCIEGKPPEA